MKSILKTLLFIALCIVPYALHSQDKVEIYAGPDKGCVPLFVSFSNLSTFNTYQGVVNYTWFIDGVPVSNNTSTFDSTFVNPRGYQCRLEARDSLGGFLGQSEIHVEANGIPDGFHVMPDTIVCPGETINFDYFFSGMIYSDKWDFGAGDMRQGKHQSLKFPSAGTYPVSLALDTECGIDTLVRIIEVTGSAQPKKEIMFPFGSGFCPDDPFKIESASPEYTVSWNMGDGNTKDGPFVEYSYGNVGQYEVTATITNTCNNTVNVTDTVFISATNTANSEFNYWFEQGDNCPNKPVRFEARGSGSYFWKFGDGTTANIRSPLHFYADTGMYKVSLVVVNGCGKVDTTFQHINIHTKEGESINNPPSFQFERDFNSNGHNDTIKVCPNETLKAFIQNVDQNLHYHWELGDGNTRTGEAVEFKYANTGTFQFSLQAFDACKRSSDPINRVIDVNAGLQPNAKLQIAPMEACPGEEFYFFDDNYHGGPSGLTYDIDFGDGNTANGIKELSDHPLHVLAHHTYATSDTFDVSFVATNLCGNSVNLDVPVVVSNDAAREPFYFVGNSTIEGGPQEGEVKDWGVPVKGDEHEFVIDISWPTWSAELNDTFYVFAWYGGFQPESEKDDGPDGMVMFTSSNIVSVDSVSIFVPLDPMAPQDIGFLVGWYCSPYKSLGDEPESFGNVKDYLGTEKQKFPLSANGFTRLKDITQTTSVVLPPWNGICNENKVKGDWGAFRGDGKFVQLHLWDSMGSGNYDLSIADDEFGKNSEFISGGKYEQANDSTLSFFPSNGYCIDTADYEVQRMGDSLKFIVINDPCSQQVSSLDKVPFGEMHYMGHEDRSGCVGDPVYFEVAGGSSYNWQFGDGGTSSEQFAYHTYASQGEYDAYVVITNNCGRVDTVYTIVEISNTNVPEAHFNVDNFHPLTGEEVHFFRHKHYDDIEQFWDYEWSFGDGSTDSTMETKHVFQNPGMYEVKLRVGNGCGTGEFFHVIHVKDASACNAEARFQFEVKADTVYFNNASVGENNALRWEFGDGTESESLNPMKIYTAPGVYKVCLSVLDTVQNCADRICEEIAVGNIECLADYGFTVNNSELRVSFVDLSKNAEEVNWDFGDNTTSALRSPSHTFAKPGNYSVVMSIFNSTTECYDERKKEIWVGDIDTSTSCFVDFDFFVDSLKVSFQSKVVGEVTGGYWDFGDGNVAYEANTEHLYSAPGIYTVCANVWDSVSGCQANKCKEVSVGSLNCKADFGFIVDSLTRSVEFFNRSTGAYSELYIEYGNGGTGITADTVITYPKPGTYEVCLSVYNSANDCYDEICKSITIPGDTQAICEAKFSFFVKKGSLDVRFNENSVTPFRSWYWSFGDGTYGNKQALTHSYAKPGVYKVCLSAYNDSAGCFDNTCRNIVVEGLDSVPPLLAEFKAIINPATNSVKFINTSTGKHTKAYWIFGDGSVSEKLDSVRHTYASFGRFNVCLIVNNPTTGESKQICKFINIGERKCTLASKFKYFTNPDSNEIRLSDASTGDRNSWFWNFGDGSTSSKQNPVKRYKKAGYYLVSLAIRNTSNGCTDYYAELIQVGSIDCFADFDYIIDPSTNTVRFEDLSNGTPDNYYWLFDDGTSSMVKEPQHQYKRSGLYFVGLGISGNSGLCNSYTTKPIQVGKVNCHADFEVYVDSLTNTAYCTAEVLGVATNLVWTFGDGGIAAGEKASHRYTAPGYFNVGLTTYDANSGCMHSTERPILIGQRGIDVEPDFFFRVDQTTRKVNFYDNSLGEVERYFWDFGNGDTAIVENPTATYAKSGYYPVCLTATTKGGVSNTKCKPVGVSTTENECLADFIFNVDSANKKVTFTDISYGNPDKWIWKFNDDQRSELQNPVVTFDTAGIYEVEFVIGNSNTKCESNVYRLINVGKGSTGLLAAFNYEVDSTQLKATGHPVDLRGFPNNNTASFLWDFGDGAQPYSGALEHTHIYESEGIYEVCFTVKDPVTGESSTACKKVEAKSSSIRDINMSSTGLNAYPNPFRESTRIVIDLPHSANVKLEVFNEIGKQIGTITDAEKMAGKHIIDWDGGFIETGLYILQLKTDSGIIKHIAIVKQ